MPEVSGTFSGRTRLQTAVSLSDVSSHELQLAEITGSHRSADENWNGAELVYWGVADLVQGSGTQRGYYENERANGDRENGTFEGKVTTASGQTTLEGTWQATAGTGRFQGLKAQGTYKGRMSSPTEVEMSWEGRYELAGAAQAA